MPSMIAVTLPVELTEAHWNKSKGLLAKAKPTGIGEGLKLLKAADASLDRDILNIAKVTQLDVMVSRMALVEAEIKRGVKAALDQAAAVEKLARKAETDFKANKLIPKSATAAAGSVAAQARNYGAQLKAESEAVRMELKSRLEAAQSEAKKAQEKAEAPDPEMLKVLKTVRGKTLPSLRVVKANNPDLPMPHFYAAVGQKAAAVMLNKTVGATEKGLLTKMLPGESGIKYFRGSMLWEAKAFTFVAEAPPSGAAKKIQAALFKLLNQKLKVRVRKTTGEIEEEQGDGDVEGLDDEGKPKLQVASGPIALAKELVERAAKLKPELERLKATGGKFADAVAQQMENFVTALGKRDMAGSAKLLARIEDVMAMAGVPDKAAPAKPAGKAVAKGVVEAWAPAVLAQAAKIDTDLAQAKVAFDTLPAGKMRTALQKEHAGLAELRASADKLDRSKAEVRILAVAKGATALAARAATASTQAADAKAKLTAWADDKVTALKALVDGQPAQAKAMFGPRLAELQALGARAKTALEDGLYADTVKMAGEVFFGAQGATTAIGSFAAEYPAFKVERDKAQAAINAIKNNKVLAAGAKNQMPRLDKEAKWADGIGPKSGYAAALEAVKNLNVSIKVVRKSAEAFRFYQAEHDKAQEAIDALKAHAEAANIAADIKEMEDRLKQADDLGKKEQGGWQKATVMAKLIAPQCADIKKMADELAKVAAKLPALTKSLTDGGAKPAEAERMAHYAAKMLATEKCSDADAIKMAKDANKFVDEGMEEQDAIMSSRVKQSLTSQGIDEAKATEVGRNLRSGGSSNADDAKAVAKGMSKLSTKALEALNKAGIKTECCRGSMTQVAPESVGEQPRGWPANMTWDDVPGAYSPSTKTVVIGTMDDGGKRKVPGPNEGPLKHGTPDLIGHEAGHAFDAADGTYKSTNAAFLAARTADVTAGAPNGMVPGTDNYFLSKAEGGANTAGAASETFAESFAMHFAGNGKWNSLKAFWVANPWGV